MSAAVAHTSDVHNAATLGQAERAYTHMQRLQSGELITASDSAMTRRTAKLETGQWPRLVKKAKAFTYALHRCRTLGKATDVDLSIEHYGHYENSDVDCLAKPLSTGQVQSIVADAPPPTDDEANANDGEEEEEPDARTGAPAVEAEADGNANPDDDEPPVLNDAEEEETSESETEDEVEMLIAAVTAQLRFESLTRTKRKELRAQLDELTKRLQAAEQRTTVAAAAPPEGAVALVQVEEPQALERELGGQRDANAPAEMTFEDAQGDLATKYGGDYRKAKKSVLRALCKGRKDPATGKPLRFGGTGPQLWKRLYAADAAAAVQNGNAGADSNARECDVRFNVGTPVEVDYGGSDGWVRGIVKTVNDDGTYDVQHPQWEEPVRVQEWVEPSDMRLCTELGQSPVQHDAQSDLQHDEP